MYRTAPVTMEIFMNKCDNCLNETDNPKFCSRSCSAIFTNKVYPKRQFKCRKCLLPKQRNTRWSKLCIDCYPIKIKYVSKYKTLGELKQAFVGTENAWPRFSNAIREQSRRLLLDTGVSFCMNCKYDKFIEVCHIKPIASFNENSLISDVNALTNLIALCPNCHWEFDHGILKLS